jgi:hypothetical protein
VCDDDYSRFEESIISGGRTISTPLNTSEDDFCVEQLLVRHGIGPNGESIGVKRYFNSGLIFYRIL